MREPGALGRFLDRHPRFAFDLIEPVQASVAIDEARARLGAFASSIAVDHSNENLWRSRREAIRSAVANIPAYGGIDWTREDYEATIPMIDKQDLRVRPRAFLRPDIDAAPHWT